MEEQERPVTLLFPLLNRWETGLLFNALQAFTTKTPQEEQLRAAMVARIRALYQGSNQPFDNKGEME